MHETPPSPNNDNDDELFRQLADLGIEDIRESIDYELEEIAEMQESLRQQQSVIQLLKEKHPVFAEFLAPFTPETGLEMYNSVMQLREWLARDFPLPEEIKYRAHFAEAIYTHIWRMADILSGIGDKTDPQVRIIIDDILPPVLKTLLLETLDELVPEGGINTQDPDDVQRAISQHKANEESSERTKALRRRVADILSAHEQEFLDKHNIYRDDPVWSEIRAWTCTNITLRNIHGRDNHDIFSFGIEDHLATLHISKADYLALVTKIEDAAS